jgi:hypothetical protein
MLCNKVINCFNTQISSKQSQPNINEYKFDKQFPIHTSHWDNIQLQIIVILVLLSLPCYIHFKRYINTKINGCFKQSPPYYSHNNVNSYCVHLLEHLYLLSIILNTMCGLKQLNFNIFSISVIPVPVSSITSLQVRCKL